VEGKGGGEEEKRRGDRVLSTAPNFPNLSFLSFIPITVHPAEDDPSRTEERRGGGNKPGGLETGFSFCIALMGPCW